MSTVSLLTGVDAVLPLGDDQYNCGGLSAFKQSYGMSWGVKRAIESLGVVIPTVLDVSYMLVYAIASFCLCASDSREPPVPTGYSSPTAIRVWRNPSSSSAWVIAA